MDPLSLSPTDEGGASQDILQRSAKRKFAVIPTTNEVTKLMDVGTLATRQQVTVLVKIITVGSAVVVKSELQKQECVVGDVSGCCRIVLWNDDNATLIRVK